MAPKLFLTGATGYIGGDALYKISKQHPEMEIALLVRSQDKAEKVSSQYPRARIVLGGLDDAETLRKEAAWADIVLRECPSHLAANSHHALTERQILLIRPTTKALPRLLRKASSRVIPRNSRDTGSISAERAFLLISTLR